MKKFLAAAVVTLSMAFVTGCASGPKRISSDPRLDYIQEGAVLQLQYNLHPQELTKTVPALNYQPAALLPRCTPVTIVSFDAVREAMEFCLNGKIDLCVECNPLHGNQVAEIIRQLEEGDTPPKMIYMEENSFTAARLTTEFIEAREY